MLGRPCSDLRRCLDFPHFSGSDCARRSASLASAVGNRNTCCEKAECGGHSFISVQDTTGSSARARSLIPTWLAQIASAIAPKMLCRMGSSLPKCQLSIKLSSQHPYSSMARTLLWWNGFVERA